MKKLFSAILSLSLALTLLFTPPTSLAASAISVSSASPSSVVLEEENKTTYVYITPTGKCYHSVSKCGNTKSSTKVTLENAKGRGLRACKKCF